MINKYVQAVELGMPSHYCRVIGSRDIYICMYILFWESWLPKIARHGPLGL